MINPLDLTARRVLVTGASSGIGQAAARLLSRLGARIVLVARDRQRLDAAAQSLDGSGHLLRTFDLADSAEIPGLIAELTAADGPLDGLVHCAGIHGAAPLRALEARRCEEILRINVTSAAMLAKGFARKGCHSDGGAIVFLASVAGITGQAGIAAYAASKAAITGLTRALAIELAPAGIRVNCIAPGMVETGMTERFRRKLTPEQNAAIDDAHPLGTGRPEDVASSVAFLLADTARWITGHTLVVDGGYSAR
jgi:NAD(P)-dependent dehydrogenase (short-subunit alcohol dehydrogenase family)